MCPADILQVEDEEVAAKVQAKNGLESYAFSLKQTINENGDKFEAADMEALETKVNEVTSVLGTSSLKIIQLHSLM